MRFSHLKRASSPPDIPTCVIFPQSFPSPTTERDRGGGSKDQKPRGARSPGGVKWSGSSWKSRAIPLEPLQYSPCSRNGEHRAKHLLVAAPEPRHCPQPWPRQPCERREMLWESAPARIGPTQVRNLGGWGRAELGCCPERGAQELPAPQARIKRTEISLYIIGNDSRNLMCSLKGVGCLMSSQNAAFGGLGADSSFD